MAEPVRFFLDEHLPLAVALGLRQHGIDVLRAQDAGRSGLPDADQLEFAMLEERVVVTFDSDYIALHGAGTPHAGIAWCHSTKYGIGQLIQALLLIHGVMDRDGMRNQIEFL